MYSENKLEADVNKKTNKLRVFAITVIAISFGLLLPTSTGYSQNYLRINEEIGGGGGTVSTDDSGNSTVYVVGWLLASGVIAYVIISKNKKKKEEADSSSAINGLNSSDLTSEFNDFEHEVAKAKDNFPVDIMIGVRNNRTFISDKTYLMGVSVRF